MTHQHNSKGRADKTPNKSSFYRQPAAVERSNKKCHHHKDLHHNCYITMHGTIIVYDSNASISSLLSMLKNFIKNITSDHQFWNRSCLWLKKSKGNNWCSDLPWNLQLYTFDKTHKKNHFYNPPIPHPPSYSCHTHQHNHTHWKSVP